MHVTGELAPDRARLARSALLNGGVALGCLAGAAWLWQATAALGALYPAKVLGAYALGLALVYAAREAHLPHSRLGAANQVTLARGGLVALLVGLVGEGNSEALAWGALAVGLLATVLDGLDGWLARRLRTASPFGARFDMETDAVLMLTLCMLAWQFDKAGPWVLLAGMMRYAFVAAGHRLRWLRQPLPPSRRRQTVCVLQLLSLLLCIAPLVRQPWSELIAAAGLALLAWSFWIDIRWLAHHDTPTPKETHS